LTQISGLATESCLPPAPASAGPLPTPNRWRCLPPGSPGPASCCRRSASPIPSSAAVPPKPRIAWVWTAVVTSA